MRDVKGLNPADLAGAALALWTFAADRRPGLPKVRVYRPSPARDGWSSPLTIVETVNEDMPFLVDSVAAYLNGSDREVRWIVHPVVAVRRDAAGHRTELLAAGAAPAGAVRESVMQFHLAPQPEGAFEAIRAGVEQVLAAVRQAMADVGAMRQRLLDEAAVLGKGVASVPPAELQSAQAFLRWLAEDHFVLLGYREAAFVGTGETARVQTHAEKSLGLLREEGFTLFDGLMRQPSLPDLVRDTLQRRTVVRVTKASRRSPVHRPIPLDVVTVQTMDDRGGITGERTFVGLFPLSVYAVSPRQVPLLAAKIDAVLQRAGYPPEGHRGKHLLHILETYPRDELFQVTADELYDLATGILELQDRLHVALFARRDPFGRFVSCLVYAPRDRYDSTLRRRFAQILERAYGGTLHNFSVNTGDVLSRVHFLIATPPGAPRDVDDEAVEQQLQEAARGWPERLQDALVGAVGGEQGLERWRRLGSAFPASYQEAHDAAAAAVDAAFVDQALATGDLAVNLYRAPGAARSTLRFKVYFTGRTAPLSEVLPMLENMGLTIQEEIPYDVRPASGALARIRDFEMVTTDGREIDLAPVRDAFHEAFTQVWRGTMEEDGFNRLILGAGLTAADVTVLRACCKYLRQAGIPFSQPYMEETLARNPSIAQGLVALFRRRFDPALSPRREEESRALADDVRRKLDAVTNLDEDRILRRFLNVIECMLRTNVWQRGADGQPAPYLAFKLDSARLDDLPLPRPFREIWVYSTRFEAIHLRGGRVARGGIRWSDRREDFRTEVLGLMKAQMVKNAVIVPVGSKGGFVLKQPPEAPRGAAGRGGALLQEHDPGPARPDRQPRRRPRGPPARRGALGRRRPVPRGGRRQGHGHLLRPRQRRLHRQRLLAGRRLRQRRLGRLRPQGHGHHRQGRLGVRQAALPRDGPRRPGAGHHLRGRGRHVGRRVRQRPAALAPPEAARRLRPSAHLRRSRAPTPQPRTPSASACSTCRARRGPTTTRRSSPRAAACSTARPSRSPCRRRCAPASASPRTRSPRPS